MSSDLRLKGGEAAPPFSVTTFAGNELRGVLRFMSKPDEVSFFNSASELVKTLEKAWHSLAAP